MRIAWAWDWLVALPVLLWLVRAYFRGNAAGIDVLLGTLLIGGVCVGMAEALGF